MEDQLLLRALHCVGDAVIVIDGQGLVRGWNPKSEQLFGFRADDVMGQPLDFMIPEKLRAMHDRGFAAAMQSGHLASDGRARRTKALRADGSTVYVVMTFALVYDDQGTAIGSVAMAREWIRDEK